MIKSCVDIVFYNGTFRFCPSKGSEPLTSVYRITPRLQTSTSGPSYFFPCRVTELHYPAAHWFLTTTTHFTVLEEEEEEEERKTTKKNVYRNILNIMNSNLHVFHLYIRALFYSCTSTWINKVVFEYDVTSSLLTVEHSLNLSDPEYCYVLNQWEVLMKFWMVGLKHDCVWSLCRCGGRSWELTWKSSGAA